MAVHSPAGITHHTIHYMTNTLSKSIIIKKEYLSQGSNDPVSLHFPDAARDVGTVERTTTLVLQFHLILIISGSQEVADQNN